ncbi:MAG: hypothetical protein OQL19_21075 [Gammaproteobacteria bacterium]|nr:hypothetical protein [Gammaproteobacteria bacterium]
MSVNKLLFLSIFLIVAGIIAKDPFSSVSYGPGVIAPDPPKQNNTDVGSFFHNDIKVDPKASFEIEAKVLAKKNYSSDPESIASPVDLALGWGRMSDESILEKISISQRKRFYYWRVDEFPIPRSEIERHSANMHLIPANESIERKIEEVEPGALVRFNGYLVNLERDNGWHWNTSLTRNDTGGGACELVWVEEFDVIHQSDVEFYE